MHTQGLDKTVTAIIKILQEKCTNTDIPKNPQPIQNNESGSAVS